MPPIRLVAKRSIAINRPVEVELSVPTWAPPHFKEEPTRTRWIEWLVEETLANLKTAIEKG